jgi:hypothetical protein
VIEESKKLYESKQSTVARERADALLAEIEPTRSASG